MPSITRDQVKVPVDVSPDMRETYIDNYMKATRETGRLMLFACDQKIEHLNKDFYDGGEDIDIADNELTHDVRKQAKRARYVAECCGELIGADALPIAKAMTSRQDDLGAICDARANIALCDAFLAEEPPDAVAWDLSLYRAQNETFLYKTLRDRRPQRWSPQDRRSPRLQPRGPSV